MKDIPETDELFGYFKSSEVEFNFDGFWGCMARIYDKYICGKFEELAKMAGCDKSF